MKHIAPYTFNNTVVPTYDAYLKLIDITECEAVHVTFQYADVKCDTILFAHPNYLWYHHDPSLRCLYKEWKNACWFCEYYLN